jgi:hypothetical protein
MAVIGCPFIPCNMLCVGLLMDAAFEQVNQL